MTADRRAGFDGSGVDRIAAIMALIQRRCVGDYTIDEYGFDAELTDLLLSELIGPMADKWFQLEVRGTENIPDQGGALVVSNHSGTLPMDALVTAYAVREQSGRHLRPLGADLVFRLPFVGQLARRLGATLACQEDATRMLRQGELVGVWPEGFKGLGKPFSERYQLQRFGRGGFVSTAISSGVPIVCCSVVGAEEAYPLIGDLPVLARLLGTPYFPVTPFFPLLGPLGLVPLPSKWIIDFSDVIHTDQYDPAQADDPLLVYEVTEQVRDSIQRRLNQLLAERPSTFNWGP